MHTRRWWLARAPAMYAAAANSSTATGQHSCACMQLQTPAMVMVIGDSDSILHDVVLISPAPSFPLQRTVSAWASHFSCLPLFGQTFYGSPNSTAHRPPSICPLHHHPSTAPSSISMASLFPPRARVLPQSIMCIYIHHRSTTVPCLMCVLSHACLARLHCLEVYWHGFFFQTACLYIV